MSPESPENPDATTASGRPRDPALERAILEATVELVAQHGVAGTTVAEIARRAGTGKAAVYRRWESKTTLVVAAVQSLQAQVTAPDTGDLRQDLHDWARHYTSGDARAAVLLANLLREASDDTQLRDAAYAAIGRPPAVALRTVVDRAVERGDVDPSVPVDVVVEIIPAYAFRQLVVSGRTLDPTTAVALVDHVLLPALLHRPG